ncbi:uncharacterized protein KQ657_001815 [Scheffersomyces spartinae]|uniref:ADP-ribosylation factor GTPase-activating protein n=1 Tax=Scheffersomyces spartinae TaxID=45513 RepID=A0A9P8AH37_9ASCO|nr:uncharacterized protein KQ657_001815 [Scheffersomyces spartinae]KAG7192416.1 hypothetical protein KQ657_001815 [Scheffersomyces spartinae]
MSVLGFPWQALRCEQVQLSIVKVSLSNEDDSYRIVANLVDCTVTKIETKTSNIVPHQFTYIQNDEVPDQSGSGSGFASASATASSPVVLQVPYEYQTIKFHVTFEYLPPHGSILILKKHSKQHGDTTFASLHQTLVSGDVIESELSRIALSKLTTSSKSVVLSDSFDDLESGMTSISLWYYSNTEDYIPLFRSKVYFVGTASPTVTAASPAVTAPPVAAASAAPIKNIAFTLSQYRRAFGFNIEDGPELRKTLKAYEDSSADVKKVFSHLHEELKSLENTMKKLRLNKQKICDTFKTFISHHGNPILKRLSFEKEFEAKFLSMFELFEANIQFFLSSIMEVKEVQKLIMDETYFSQSESLKKTFEGNSKDYYSWLKVYLTNEKDKPESKLLIKRKTFVSSNFDYLDHLISPISNPIFLRILGSLFAFTGGDEDFDKTAIDNALEKKPLQKPSNSKYYIYINVASQFLSERLQFRKMISKCKNNEQLTNLISHYLLNNFPQETIIITPSNLDLVFKDFTHNPNDEPSHQLTDNQGGRDTSISDSEMSGILYKLGGKGKPGWHKELVILKDALLSEYSDWRKAKIPSSPPIEIVLANVKPVVYEKRQNCFELITPSGHKHIFQAINEDDLNKWLKAIANAKSMNTSKFALLHGSDPSPSSIQHNHNNRKEITYAHRLKLNTNVAEGTGASASPTSFKSSPVTKNYLSNVRLVPDGNNSYCVDCNSKESVEWVSINLLCCFCIRCSSCHRNLGTHVSKIRSLVLDYFDGEVEELLNFVNNKNVNAILEANVPPGMKPSPNSSDEQRLRYVKMKYVEKKFLCTANDVEPHQEITVSLIRLVQQINMFKVLQLYLMGGDINATVQLSNHEQVPLVEYSLRKYIEVEDPTTRALKKLFVVTEFMVLNGCKLDTIKSFNPALQLTPEAKTYFKNRAAKLGYVVAS